MAPQIDNRLFIGSATPCCYLLYSMLQTTSRCSMLAQRRSSFGFLLGLLQPSHCILGQSYSDLTQY